MDQFYFVLENNRKQADLILTLCPPEPGTFSITQRLQSSVIHANPFGLCLNTWKRRVHYQRQRPETEGQCFYYVSPWNLLKQKKCFFCCIWQFFFLFNFNAFIWSTLHSQSLTVFSVKTTRNFRNFTLAVRWMRDWYLGQYTCIVQ